MRLLVVIVNYRTPDLTIDCLRSLEPEVRRLGSTRVVVADNASGDGSPQRIRGAIEAHGWSGWAALLPLDHNGGFSSGNNAVIRPALESSDKPEFVLLLNSDTVVCPGALGALLEFMDSHPDVGIAGSRLEDPDGTHQHSRYRFHSVWSELDSGLKLGLVTRLLRNRVVSPPLADAVEPHPVDWVAGASMMVRRRVFEDIGLLDSGFFLYFEEVDFCLNARRAGWTCWYVPSSRVMHLVGRSTGFTRETPARRPRYWFESRRRYFEKNHGRFYALGADVAWAVGFALWRVRRIVQRKPDTDPPHMLWDFLRFRLRPGRNGRTVEEGKTLASRMDTS